MSKGKKRLQYFSIIMQIVFQAVLLFPWMNLGTWKCNVPWYLIKMLGSGNGLGYVKSSLKPLGALEGLDSQATGIHYDVVSGGDDTCIIDTTAGSGESVFYIEEQA